jgi:ligand-binding sensor domain-containing protein
VHNRFDRSIRSRARIRILTACLFHFMWMSIGETQSSHQIFEHLSTDNGLSSNKVEAILQDKEGFYWIATQNGLNRYDGSTFKVFRHHAEDSSSLAHNH